MVDKIPLTHPIAAERENWAWTDANRVRRSVVGYTAEREFLEANMLQVGLEKQLIEEAEEGDVEFAGAPASPGSVQTAADHEPMQTPGAH